MTQAIARFEVVSDFRPAGELPARSSAHQQSAADLQSDLDARLAALGAVADGVYARWAEGLKR